MARSTSSPSSSDYASRLSVPLEGDRETEFFTKSGIKLAQGYKRIVVGDRGPYVEFPLEWFDPCVIRATFTQHFYYIELRSSPPDNVKIYVQLERVGYADYVPGMCYVSPFELYDAAGNVLITPLRG